MAEARSDDPPPWPHAPVHRMSAAGAYMITAATYQKNPIFAGSERLDLLLSSLLAYAEELDWRLQAWSVFPNHYHFIALAPEHPETMTKLLGKLHTLTARAVNRLDEAPGRKVWHQFWDSLITYDGSYYARLKYVHRNPEHHGVAARAENYRWCPAAWFQRTANHAFQNTIMGMKTDRVRVKDDF